MRTAKAINQLRGTPGAAFWQRNYYEHIIRTETALEKIREYIANNPEKERIEIEKFYDSPR